MIYEVVYCADCKKPLKSVPAWLAGVNVRFSCDTCRQRHPRAPLGHDAPAGRDFAAEEDVVAADPVEVVEDEPVVEIEAEDSPVIDVED